MNFSLSDEQIVLQRSVREMCDRIIVPNAKRDAGGFPPTPA